MYLSTAAHALAWRNLYIGYCLAHALAFDKAVWLNQASLPRSKMMTAAQITISML